MTNAGSAISTTRQLVEGTAYILYGSAPSDLNLFVDQGQDSLFTEDPKHSHRQENEQNRHQSQHHHHHHHHHHDRDQEHDPDLEPPKHFWAIFYPEKYTRITSDGSTSTAGGAATDSHFFLSGTPYTLGSFPPEMPEPHGCIPPHLYYKVSLFRPCLKSPTTTDDLDTDGSRDRRSDSEEHIIPFVHRFGDGKDDAGGLTTGYHLLQELESADDYGAFMDELIHVFQSASVASSTNNRDNHRISRGNPSRSSKGVSLYACTEVLFSDTKTRQLIRDHFFSLTTRTPLPPALMQFVNHCYESSASTEPSDIPRILKSDLKIFLPMDDPPLS